MLFCCIAFISVEDPGCLSQIPDPQSWFLPIPDPKTATKERGEKKLVMRNCGWSGTQQQHSTHNTKRMKISGLKNWLAKLWLEWDSTTTQQAQHKANDDMDATNTCRIFVKIIRKWGGITEEWRNCGWSETRQIHSKHETRRTMLLKTSKPVEFSQ
jgi:hypothetical protein